MAHVPGAPGWRRFAARAASTARIVKKRMRHCDAATNRVRHCSTDLGIFRLSSHAGSRSVSVLLRLRQRPHDGERRGTASRPEPGVLCVAASACKRGQLTLLVPPPVASMMAAVASCTMPFLQCRH